MRHLTSSAMRAACATLLLLPAAACAPAVDPAKACASAATVDGLKSVLLSAAAQGTEGSASRSWASLPGAQLILELPRLAGFDKTTRKATCEGRFVTTAPGQAVGPLQRTSEDVSYTVQPSAREGEIIYGVTSAPLTIAVLHTLLISKSSPTAPATPQAATISTQGKDPTDLPKLFPAAYARWRASVSSGPRSSSVVDCLPVQAG